MKYYFTILPLLFLLSCSSGSVSSSGIDISGRWTECREISPLDIAFIEVNFSNESSTVVNTVFSGIDNQCINIAPVPVFKTNATVILEHPHITISGLMVYDYTLVDVTGWDKRSNTISPQPNIYSILYLDGDKLYSGKRTTVHDRTSEARRPDEIEFSTFLTKQSIL